MCISGAGPGGWVDGCGRGWGGVAGRGCPLSVGRCPWASVSLERCSICVREFARCVQVDWHPSQVHACLQPGVCLQVCLLSSVPSGPREPPTHVPERPCPGAENRENGAISQSPDSCFLRSGGGCGLIRQVWEVCSVCCSLASVTPKTLETWTQWRHVSRQGKQRHCPGLGGWWGAPVENK